MKKLIYLLPVIAVVGCGSSPAPAAAPSGKGDALTQKLQAMTPDERTAYVKSHMGEVTASANVSNPIKK